MMNVLKKFLTFSRLSALLCLVWMATPSWAFEIEVKEFTLGNGMRIILLPNKQSPAVIHSLWYKVGAADDPAGKSGLAHFLEHLMYKGTRERPAGDYFSTVDRFGAEINAFTTRDYTVYHVRMERSMLPTVMALEAERMRGLVIRDFELETERLVVKEERRERYENDPAAQIDEQIEQALLPGHPYGKPVIGLMDELQGITVSDAEAFYNRYYHPNNAVAIVSGDVTLDEIRKLAEEHYGPLPPSALLPNRQSIPLPTSSLPPEIVVINPQATSNSVKRYYRVPSLLTATGNEAYALDFLATILASGTHGRLFEELVVKSKIASDVSADYAGQFLFAGEFQLWGVPAQGFTTEDLRSAIDRVIQDVLRNGVTQDELDRAIKRARIASIYALDRPMKLVELVGNSVAIGLKPTDLLKHDQFSRITAEEVNAVARKYIHQENSITGIVVRAAGN